ncbi:hypothetical protein Cni_G20007 [Canna indica]|uniref:TFIIS central domain-containing protein n=1 Tax=Canna indica TaxID=4628 RepID=A0AAQ3KMD9_9LILI|nr:hypothetical protein Cni_G20007 [Canna indica]
MESSEKGQTTMSSNQASQQLSSSNQSSQELLPMFHTPLAVSWGAQEWLSADKNLSQTGMQVPVPVILGSQQFLSMVNQSIQMNPSYRSLNPMPTSVGLDQLPLQNRQILGGQSSINIRPSLSAKPASQPLSSINKRPIQVVPPTKFQGVMPMNMGTQSPSTNRRPGQQPPLQKVQSESFESVRSKLRESLAASLAMVSEKSNNGDAPPAVAKAVMPQVDESNSETQNVSDKSLPNVVSDVSAPRLDEVQSVGGHASKENTMLVGPDGEKLQSKDGLLREEVPNDNCFVKDDLLQGHGLCWASDLDVEAVSGPGNHDRKRLKLTNEQETLDKETIARNAEQLAFKIEAELFRLFGGVNKKYKEKGRSLLFNLKDRSNPELRERVLSGDIAPERLCTMTIEELASKELSQWRLAKAEELAQMVVLPDSDVDLRRLVKKTHKGEFQVEVEQVESFPTEVELGTSVLPQVSSKTNKDVKTQSNSDEPKASGSRISARKINSGNENIPNDIEILHEKTDLMQELMVDDEVKDPELLPPIVSLDEFMEALDSEPPFENLPVDSVQEVPSTRLDKSDCLEPEKVPASDSVELQQDGTSDSLETKPDPSQDGSPSKMGSSQEDMQLDLGSADAPSKDPATVVLDKVDKQCSRNDDDLKSDPVNIQSDAHPSVSPTSDKIWEGLIQLNVSAVATVIGFLRSGEKASTQEWPSFLEIKGRVRLDAFERFLKDLPLSRSRAIMIVQFRWKEGTDESGRLSLLEICDSYIADDRVGFAEPAPGVELYFCPPHSRTVEIFEKCLPKDHIEALNMAVDGLIGVVVWRRPHVTVSPRVSSHHKHGSSRKHLSSRKQQLAVTYNAPKSSLAPTSSGKTRPIPDDDDIDDVPPGFGPKDDDDLPEFDFIRGSSHASKPASSMIRPHVLPPARPVDQIRELIHKYGQSENAKKPYGMKSWNDDDDDIPEWRPQDDHHTQAQLHPPPLPSQPPQPLPSQQQLHAYQQQQPLQPVQVNQQMLSIPALQHFPSHPHVQLQQPAPMVAALSMAPQPPLPPQLTMMQAPLNMQPRWQQPQMLPLAGVPAAANMMQSSHYNLQPNVDGQVYSLPNLGAVQNVMGWRPDVYGSRGA